MSDELELRAMRLELELLRLKARRCDSCVRGDLSTVLPHGRADRLPVLLPPDGSGPCLQHLPAFPRRATERHPTMSTKPTLLLDMDGPLADFDTYGWERCAAAGHEFDAGFHDRRHRFFTDHMPHLRHRKDARRMIESPGWFADLPVTQGATDGVPELMGHFDVWVCTKPLEANPTCRDEKGSWLRRHFPMLEDRLIITPDKSLIRGSILLDDAIKPSWVDAAEWLPVVFSEPFNGEGSQWADWLHWTWADGVESLLILA